MDRIARAVEPSMDYRHELPEAHDNPTIGGAMSNAACDLAEALRAAAILVPTFTGRTANAVARLRPRRPIVALTHIDWAMRQLALEWGVTPLLIPESADVEDLWQHVDRRRARGRPRPVRRPRRHHRRHRREHPGHDERHQGRHRVEESGLRGEEHRADDPPPLARRRGARARRAPLLPPAEGVRRRARAARPAAGGRAAARAREGRRSSTGSAPRPRSPRSPARRARSATSARASTSSSSRTSTRWRKRLRASLQPHGH